MKVLTLRQPWASLVACGAKKIETRSWKTDYRGELAIQASASITKSEKDLCYERPFCNALNQRGSEEVLLPTGVIIATCRLVEVRLITSFEKWYLEPFYNGTMVVIIPPPNPEFDFGDYTPGRYAWILAEAKRLDNPVPVKGKLGLWEYEGELK